MASLAEFDRGDHGNEGEEKRTADASGRAGQADLSVLARLVISGGLAVLILAIIRFLFLRI